MGIFSNLTLGTALPWLQTGVGLYGMFQGMGQQRQRRSMSAWQRRDAREASIFAGDMRKSARSYNVDDVMRRNKTILGKRLKTDIRRDRTSLFQSFGNVGGKLGNRDTLEKGIEAEILRTRGSEYELDLLDAETRARATKMNMMSAAMGGSGTAVDLTTRMLSGMNPDYSGSTKLFTGGVDAIKALGTEDGKDPVKISTGKRQKRKDDPGLDPGSYGGVVTK